MLYLIVLILWSVSVNCAEPDSPRTAFKKSLAQLKQSKKKEPKSALTITELLNLFTEVPAEKLDLPLSDLKQKWDVAEKNKLCAQRTFILSLPPLMLGFPFQIQESMQLANRNCVIAEQAIIAQLQKMINDE